MFPWHYDYNSRNETNGFFEPMEFFFDTLISYQIDLEGIKSMHDIAYLSLDDKDQHTKDQIKQINNKLSNENVSDYRREESTYEKFKLLSLLGKEKGLLKKALILLMVSNYDHFLYLAIIELYKQHPEWRSVHEKELLEKPYYGKMDLDKQKKEVAKKAVSSFTRSSRINQIRFIDKKLGTKIEFHYSSWEDFIEITERRNLFVHTGGAISPQYQNICKKYNIELDEGDDWKLFLSVDDDYIGTAIDCFYELAFIIAQEVSRRVYKEVLSIADDNVLREVIKLLEEERWDNAERILQYAVSIPKDLTTGKYTDLFIMNLSFLRSIADKSFKHLLDFIDWNGADEVFELLEQQTFMFLRDKRWEIAERFYEYILYTIDDLSLQIDAKIFVINNCIAKKFANKPFLNILHSTDWSKEGKEYQLAVAILEDKYEVALELMKTDYVREKISEEEYRTWPIFIEFSKSDGFKKVFSEIFNIMY